MHFGSFLSVGQIHKFVPHMAPRILNLDTQQTLQQLWPLCLSARLRTKFDSAVFSIWSVVR